MNKTNSKWFTNKKFVIISILLAFAVSVFSALVFNLKQNTVEAVSNVEETVELEEKQPAFSSSVSVAYNKNSGNQISLLANTGTNGTWLRSSGTIPTKFDGGTTIFFKRNTQTVKYSTTATTYDSATEFGYPGVSNGYSLAGFKIYYEASGAELDKKSPKKTLTFATDGDWSSGYASITTETIAGSSYDPAKVITIQAFYSVNTYYLNLYYSTTGQNSDYIADADDKTSYNVENRSVISSTTKKPENNSTGDGVLDVNGFAFNRWVMLPNNDRTSFSYSFTSADNPQDDQDDSTSLEDGGIIKVTAADGSGEWEFVYSERIDNKETSATGDYIYYINNVQGWGDLIQQNTATLKPILIAKWSIKYNITIDNSNTIWTNPGNKKYYDLNSGGNANKMSGVALSGSSWSYANKQNIKIQAGRIGYDIDDGNGLAFKKNTEVITSALSEANVATEKKFAVYNYGHKISNWKITIEYNGIKYLYYKEKDNAWDISGTETTISTSILTNSSTTKKLAEYLDENGYAMTNEVADKLKLTLIPDWEAEKFTVVNTLDNSKTKELTYNAASYSLSDIKASADKEPKGKTLIYYTSADGDIVAESAKWNYVDIAASSYDYDSNKYTVNLTPVYVDNIYKVNLIYTKSDGYTLDNKNITSGYSYSATDPLSGYSKTPQTGVSLVTFNSSSAASTFFGYSAYNSATHALVESYTSAVLNSVYTTYNNYLNKAAGVSTAFDTVYSDEDGYYIYLANNHAVGSLPVFSKQFETLISWDTNFANNNYAYKTEAYDPTAHLEDYQGTTNGQPEYVGSNPDNTIWKYEHMLNGATPSMSLKAHFFRKEYYLSLETILTSTATVGRYGYVKIQIVDNVQGSNYSGNYVAIFNNENVMAVYKVSDITKYSDLTAEQADVNESTSNIKEISLWAGCDVTFLIVDQSKNPTYATNDKSIIGYRYTSLQFDALKTITYAGDSSYTVKINDEEIDGMNLKTKSTLDVNVNFENIEYDFGIVMDSYNAQLSKAPSGNFVVTREGGLGTSANTALVNYTEVIIGNQFDIKYNATAGYKFKTAAFTFKTANAGSSDNLATYNDETAELTHVLNGNKYIDQTYILPINGDWLYKYYYYYNNSFSRENASLGVATINTEEITFDYNYKIYNSDSDEILEDNYFETNKTGVKLSVPINNVAKNVITEIVDPSKESSSLYVVQIGTNKYAFISTRVYKPNNPYHTDVSGGNYKIYPFALKTNSLTDDSIILTSAKVADMLNVSASGTIIPVNNRILYILVEIKELKTIEVEILGNEELIDGLETTVTSGENNALVVNSGTDSNYKIYSHSGLTNNISSVFNTTRCAGVSYYYIDPAYPLSSSFKIIQKMEHSSNAMKIYVVPEQNKIDARINYYLNDDPTTLTQLIANRYLADAYTIKGVNNITNGSKIELSYTLIKDNYYITFEINDQNKEDADTENADIYKLIHNVVWNDLDTGLTIDVSVIEFDSDVLVIEYVLDSAEPTLGPEENLGTRVVYVGEDPITGAIKVYADQELSVDIDGLASGYEYTGVVVHNGEIKNIALSGTKITLTSKFVVATETSMGDAGIYSIIVKRIPLTATLTYSNTLLTPTIANETYKMKVNGVSATSDNINTKEKSLSDVKVGNTVYFEDTSTDLERLDYYYYVDSSGTHVPILSTEDGSALRSILITSDLLDKVGDTTIVFGIETIKKYKLNVVITGEDYVGSTYYENHTSGTVYELNTPVDQGTEIRLNLTTTIPTKYSIVVGENAPVDALSDFAVFLDGDKEIQIQISPKQYNLAVTEFTYTTLKDIKDNTPDSGDTATIARSYLTDYVVTKTRNDETKQLQKIVIKGNDGPEIIININGATIEANYDYKDGNAGSIDLAGLEALGYRITFFNEGASELVRISFAALNNAQLEVYYTNYVDITSSN